MNYKNYFVTLLIVFTLLHSLSANCGDDCAAVLIKEVYTKQTYTEFDSVASLMVDWSKEQLQASSNGSSWTAGIAIGWLSLSGGQSSTSSEYQQIAEKYKERRYSEVTMTERSLLIQERISDNAISAWLTCYQECSMNQSNGLSSYLTSNPDSYQLKLFCRYVPLLVGEGKQRIDKIEVVGAQFVNKSLNASDSLWTNWQSFELRRGRGPVTIHIKTVNSERTVHLPSMKWNRPDDVKLDAIKVSVDWRIKGVSEKSAMAGSVGIDDGHDNSGFHRPDQDHFAQASLQKIDGNKTIGWGDFYLGGDVAMGIKIRKDTYARMRIWYYQMQSKKITFTPWGNFDVGAFYLENDDGWKGPYTSEALSQGIQVDSGSGYCWLCCYHQHEDGTKVGTTTDPASVFDIVACEEPEKLVGPSVKVRMVYRDNDGNMQEENKRYSPSVYARTSIQTIPMSTLTSLSKIDSIKLSFENPSSVAPYFKIDSMLNVKLEALRVSPNTNITLLDSNKVGSGDISINYLPSALVVSPDGVDFGEIKIGLEVKKEIEIRNAGQEKIIVKSIASDCLDFSSINQGPIEIDPNKTIRITVKYLPSRENLWPDEGNLLIHHNGKAQASPISVPIVGMTTLNTTNTNKISPSKIPLSIKNQVVERYSLLGYRINANKHVANSIILVKENNMIRKVLLQIR